MKKLRKARMADIKSIQKLIEHYARREEMLPRSIHELYEHVRDFWVREEKGKIIGCAALHIDWADLAEIKSLAVLESKMNRGVGTSLLKACMKEAEELGVKKIFALTYRPEFFVKNGFLKISKNRLPRKIWSECVRCVKFPNCDEVALMKEITER